MHNGVCLKCDSTDVISRVRIMDRGESAVGDLQVVVPEKPDALFFQGRQYGTLYAWICGFCGFTELYVSGPAELLAAYRKSQGQETTLKLD